MVSADQRKNTAASKQKLGAYKELLQIARSGIFDIWYTYAGGAKSWPLHCFDPLYTNSNRQLALNDILYTLTQGNPPGTVERIEEERRIIQLVLKAGADPNYSCSYDTPSSVFDSFIAHKKFYGALEVAKTAGFGGPKNPEETFKILEKALYCYLRWGCPYPGGIKSVADLNAQICEDQRKLVGVLYGKGICPQDAQIRQALQPVFEEEKQKLSAHMKKAAPKKRVSADLTAKKGGRNDPR